MKLKLQFIFAMLVFGSIGIFVTQVDIPSPAIVQWRTIIATVFLALLYIVKKQKPNLEAIRRNIVQLLVSGAVLGGNWAFLFLAYHHTSVGIATILYYFAPIIVFLLAPIFLKERPNKLQILGITAAVFGTVLANSKEFLSGSFSISAMYVLIAAALYATVMLCNSLMHDISGLDSTFVQLGISAIVMTIYCTFTTGNVLTFSNTSDMLIILLLGVFHTGFIFPIYFYAIQKLPAHDVAIFSYIDPASAIVFSAVFLSESLTPVQIVSAILVFGGALFVQLQGDNNEKKNVSTEIN